MKKIFSIIFTVCILGFSNSCSLNISALETPQIVSADYETNSVILNWDEVKNASGFSIYRSFTNNSADFTIIDTTEKNTYRYSDNLADEEIPAGTSAVYYYIVAESMFFASSEPSAIVSVTISTAQ